MDLVEELRNNPENGARRLETEYKAGLLALARRLCADEGDAEELVNGTFAEVVRSIDRYAEQSAFFGWMARIMIHLNGRKNDRKSNRTVVASEESPDAVADPDADARLFREVDAALLRDAIDGLPADIRKTLVMHCFMDMSVKDVARFLALPVGTVTWRLHYARQMLAAKLGTQKPGVKLLVFALLLSAGLAVGGGLYALGAAAFGSRAESAEVVSHAENAESAEIVSRAEDAEDPNAAEGGFEPPFSSTLSPSSTPNSSEMNAKPLLAAASLALAAAPAAHGGWTYDATANTLSNDNGWVFNTSGTADELVVTGRKTTPSTVQDADFRTVKADTGCTIVRFGNRLFQNCNNVGLCGIPASTRTLGAMMFAWGTVTNLAVEPGYAFTEIPQKFAFGTVKAWDFEIVEGVTNIAAESLKGYSGDADGVLRVPASCEAIGASAFSSGKFTRLEFADGCGITSIADSAFYSCAAKNVVVLPDGVTSIGRTAFAYASLSGIVLPDALKTIDYRAFYSTTLKNVVMPERLETVAEQAFSGAGLSGPIRFPASLDSIGDSAFAGNPSVTEYVFEEGCTRIGKNAFQKANSCTNVVFPKSLATLGGGALFGNDYWGSMKTGTITWKSCPAFDDGGTNLFFRCAYVSNAANGTGRDMTITNVLANTRWEKFASDYRSEYGYEFDIPDNRHLVGTWFSGRNEAVVRAWDAPTLLLIF